MLQALREVENVRDFLYALRCARLMFREIRHQQRIGRGLLSYPSALLALMQDFKSGLAKEAKSRGFVDGIPTRMSNEQG